MNHRLHFLVPLLQLPKAVYETLISVIAPEISIVELFNELKTFYSFQLLYGDLFQLTPYDQYRPLLRHSYVSFKRSDTLYITNVSVLIWDAERSLFFENSKILDRWNFFRKLFEVGIHN